MARRLALGQLVFSQKSSAASSEPIPTATTSTPPCARQAAHARAAARVSSLGREGKQRVMQPLSPPHLRQLRQVVDELLGELPGVKVACRSRMAQPLEHPLRERHEEVLLSVDDSRTAWKQEEGSHTELREERDQHTLVIADDGGQVHAAPVRDGNHLLARREIHYRCSWFAQQVDLPDSGKKTETIGA